MPEFVNAEIGPVKCKRKGGKHLFIENGKFLRQTPRNPSQGRDSLFLHRKWPQNSGNGQAKRHESSKTLVRNPEEKGYTMGQERNANKLAQDELLRQDTR